MLAGIGKTNNDIEPMSTEKYDSKEVCTEQHKSVTDTNVASTKVSKKTAISRKKGLDQVVKRRLPITLAQKCSILDYMDLYEKKVGTRPPAAMVRRWFTQTYKRQIGFPSISRVLAEEQRYREAASKKNCELVLSKTRMYKGKVPEVETVLKQWYDETQRQCPKKKITAEVIRKKGIEVFKQLQEEGTYKDVEICWSDSWVTGFKRRAGLNQKQVHDESFNSDGFTRNNYFDLNQKGTTTPVEEVEHGSVNDNQTIVDEDHSIELCETSEPNQSKELAINFEQSMMIDIASGTNVRSNCEVLLTQLLLLYKKQAPFPKLLETIDSMKEILNRAQQFENN